MPRLEERPRAQKVKRASRPSHTFTKFVYGEEARSLAKAVTGDTMQPGEYDVTTKIYLTVKYVEGQCTVEMRFQV